MLVRVHVQDIYGDAPVAIAAVPSHGSTMVYLDAKTAELLVLQPGSATGDVLRRIGGVGTASDEFTLPSSVSVGRDGHYFVADTGNNRISEFDVKGAVVRSFGSVLTGHHHPAIGLAVARATAAAASAPTMPASAARGAPVSADALLSIREPVSVAVNSKSNIVVLCRDSTLVRMYSRLGEFLCTLRVPHTDADADAAPSDGTLCSLSLAGQVVVRSRVGPCVCFHWLPQCFRLACTAPSPCASHRMMTASLWQTTAAAPVMPRRLVCTCSGSLGTTWPHLTYLQGLCPSVWRVEPVKPCQRFGVRLS